jgi:Holliday junction resolvase RusA-like endonuclease
VLDDEPVSEIVRVHIPVQIPSKKNKLRPRANRRGYHYDEETRAQLDAIEAWILKAWRPRRAIAHPRIDVHYFYVNDGQDRDGIWTTVLDCLKKAGVIHDDNIRCFNGFVAHHPAQRVLHPRDAGVVLEITVTETTDGKRKPK